MSDANFQFFIAESDRKAIINSPDLFCDGTFKLVRFFKREYRQLFVMSIRQSDNEGKIQKSVPVVMVFMKEKSERAYLELFERLITFLGEKPKTEKLICDFESSLINAALYTWQSIEIFGCDVHFIRLFNFKTQNLNHYFSALKRRLVKEGLYPFCKKGKRLYSWWTSVKGQSFLPYATSPKTKEAFNLLMNETRVDLQREKFPKIAKFKKFSEYLK